MNNLFQHDYGTCDVYDERAIGGRVRRDEKRHGFILPAMGKMGPIKIHE